MKSIKSRYNYNPSQPLSKEYQDAQVFNAYYKCFDTQTNKYYLLSHFKSQNKTQVASLYKKFTNIKQKMNVMNKEHLSQIYEIIIQNKERSLFLVLDYLEGGSIIDYIGKVYTLDSKTAFKVIMGVLKALQQLHQHDLVNTFINLENIEIDHKGNARLSFKSMIYKTIYLSPQFRKDHIKSKQSDLFSLGVCLYRLIYGVFPFKSQKVEEFIDLVIKGPSFQIYKTGSFFPIIADKPLREIIGQLLDYNGEMRVEGVKRMKQEYFRQLKSLQQMSSRSLLSQVESKLRGKYISVLRIRDESDETETVVLDVKQKKILKLLLYSSSKQQIELYVKNVINKYGKLPTDNFLKIYEYQILSQKTLLILYTYSAQHNLLNYKQAMSPQQTFTQKQITHTISTLITGLKLLNQPHCYISNQTLFIKNGSIKILFPPFKTNRISSKINQVNKKINNYISNTLDFMSPELLQNKVSLNTDSWSIGVLQYWMLLNQMPQFDSKGTLLINSKQKLPKQKLSFFHNLIQIDPNNRLNLLTNQQLKNKLSNNIQNSFNQFLSPNQYKNPLDLKTSPLNNDKKSSYNNDKRVADLNDRKQNSKLSPDKNIMNKDKDNLSAQNKKSTLVNNGNTQNINLSSFNNKQTIQNKSPYGKSKTVGLQFNSIEQPKTNQNKLQNQYQQSNTSAVKVLQKPKRSRAKDYPLYVNNNTLQPNSTNTNILPNKIGPEDQINYKYKTPIIVSTEAGLPQKNRNKFDMKIFNQTEQIKSPQKIQTKQRSKIKYNEPTPPFSQQIKEYGMNLGLKFGMLQRSYSKPIRLSIKCIIVVLFYVFLFYFSFFKNTGSLISSRETYEIKVVQIRAFATDSSPNINYTLISTTPSETHKIFYNTTLPVLRDEYRCVLNDYSVRSNVNKVIKSSGFVAYEVFGILFAIFHIISMCIVIGRMDLCKACSLSDFYQKKFYPLLNYGFIILAIVSLTSLHYLIYGGLYHLRLQPCLGKSNLPGLEFLMKNWVSSWVLRFVWIYIGIMIAYVVMVFFLIKPNKSLHPYIYIGLLVLYLAGVGVRAIGKTYPSHQNVFGLSGQLLAIIVGICLFVTDLLFACFSKVKPQTNAQNNLDTRSIQDFNKTQEFFFGNTGIQDDFNQK